MFAVSSLLFVPGSRPDRFAKAAASGADLVVIDLEDAVAEADKAEARGKAIAHIAADTSRRFALRCNALSTDHGHADLGALHSSSARPAALFVPMVENADDLAVIGQMFGPAALSIVPLVETSSAIMAAHSIAAAPGVAAVMLGGADLCAQLGVPMSWDALLHARGALVLACAAAQVAAIDVPHILLDDPAGLEEETRRVRAMGFSAKAAIHPAQVSMINAVMRPTHEELAEAHQALSAYEDGGRRAIRYRGRMLEAPIIRQYQSILARGGNGSDA